MVPSDEDIAEASRRLLAGMAVGADANDLVRELSDLHIPRNTFPGEVFMEIGAEALAVAAVDRRRPLDATDLLSAHLPEVSFRGKEHRRIQYAVFTTFTVHGGLIPDLLDEVGYWIEQYWQYALFATVAIIRACADRSEMTIEAFVADMAAERNVRVA